MKIRQGFVSNSSSSSFIVAEKNLTTTARTALMMISIIMEEYENDGWGLPEGVDEAVEFLLHNMDFDKPICFPWGINYETFICRTPGGIFVDTCNNHPWWNYFKCDDADENDGEYNTLYLELSSMETVDRNYYITQCLRG